MWAYWLYCFTYMTVLYVLAAHSAGYIVMITSMSFTFLLAVFVGVLSTFQVSDSYNNESIDSKISCHGESLRDAPGRVLREKLSDYGSTLQHRDQQAIDDRPHGDRHVAPTLPSGETYELFVWVIGATS